MKLGFIGFGEVAYEVSRGLKEDGLDGIVAYDPMKNNPKYEKLIQERATAAAVTLLDTPGAVVKAADIIISAVPGSYALQAAEGLVTELNEQKIYADVSTSSPTIKQKIAELIEPTGAGFVDGALMAGLTLHQHKVPALVSGNAASKFIELMTPYHMSLNKVSDRAGDAIAVKLVRSIYTSRVSMAVNIIFLGFW